jgi:glycosyltransferase involved in cell wall biosynthesis
MPVDDPEEFRSSPPWRIGIDVTAAITQGGGIGRFTRELTRAVVAADRHNQYRLFSAKAPAMLPVFEPLPVAANVTFSPAPLNERWLFRLWFRLRLPLPVQWVTGPLDLFHSPDFVLAPVSGRVPTLLTIHDLSFVHFPATFPAPLVKYLNRVVPRSIQRATHILADSRSTKKDLIDVWQVPAQKITVLHGGVDDIFRPVSDQDQLQEVRARHGIGDEPYILSVGTIQPRKNYQMLIRAFRPVAARWPHNLVVAGSKGWLYNEILEEVTRQGLEGRIKFVGYVGDDDLPPLYSGATLFVFPSLYEGFGLPLLEAMACGVPVITSNSSSLPEVVETRSTVVPAVQLSPNDEAGWSEAVNQLLADPARRASMVAEGFRQARRFSWAGPARQLVALYRRLILTSTR